MIVHICRKEEFSAAHRVFRPDWSEEKNAAVFGPCANANWHGHNFTLTVKVKGELNPNTGYVMDMKVLGQMLREDVISKLDHKNMNEEVDFLKGVIPTCEVVVQKIWEIIAPKITAHTEGRAQLHCIILQETDKNYVEYYGE